MKNSFIPAILGGLLTVAAIPALAQDQGSGDAWIFNPSYNTTGNSASYAQVGGEFQVVAADVPSGDTLEVTGLGWYSVSGSAPSVNINISLWGGSATHGFTSSSGNLLTTATVNSGTAVSSDGFAWVTLSTPIALTAGDYYNLLESAESGNVTYLQPYDNGSSGHASAIPSVGSPITLYEGMYSVSGFAYSGSEYLGPDVQYEIEGPNPVPEPGTMALVAGGVAIGLGLRRRR